MAPARTFVIATRGSQLALWQAETVKALLDRRGHRAELRVIKTAGDRVSERFDGASGAAAAPEGDGSKRLFVKDIEDALLRGDADIAVHSAKDLPADLPPGLTLAAVLPREDPRDAVVLPLRASALADARALLDSLGTSPLFGTSSIRRSAQLRAVVPGARFAPVRGNVDTRLRKLDEERPAGAVDRYDALILAAAGLRRLGLAARISALLPVELCTPAPGQGIIAIETREADDVARRAARALDDEESAAALEAERALVMELGGGCQLPLGGLAELTPDGQLALSAVVIAPDASRALRRRLTGEIAVPAALGQRVAQALLKDGAAEILQGARPSAQGAP